MPRVGYPLEEGHAAAGGAAQPGRGEAGIQRFADGARLYPHAHALVPEGVFVASAASQTARFFRLDPP